MKQKRYKLGLFTVLMVFVCLSKTNSINAMQVEEMEEIGAEPDSEQNKEDFVVEDGILWEYRGHDAKVVIPEGVVFIMQDVFREDSDIVNVIIPEGVKSIGEMAFYNCPFLESVQFPETLEEVRGGAFADCTSLKDVQMPQNPVYIGDFAFARCKNLKSIDLSAIKFMDEGAFADTALTQVDISSFEGGWSGTGEGVFAGTDIDFSGLEHLGMDTIKANPFRDSRYWKEYGKGEKKNTFWIVDGVLLSGQNCSGKVEIPETVTRIAAYAFAKNDKITSVSIPDTVTAIGRAAFSECKKLWAVTMKDSVTELGKEAFTFCLQLSEVRLSNRIEVLPQEFFGWCPKLTKLTLPEKIIRLEDGSLPFVFPKKITLPTKGLETVTYPNLFSEDILYVTDINQVEQSPVLKEWAQDREIRELALTDVKLTLHVGEKYPLRFNSGAKATWKSSRRSVATVGQTGNIYAKKPGTTVITATIYGKEYTCRVKVVKE